MKTPESRHNKEVEFISASTFMMKPHEDEYPQHDHPPQNQHDHPPQGQQPLDHLHDQQQLNNNGHLGHHHHQLGHH